MASHKALSGADIHVVAAYTYANATARNAATGFVSADLGKLAWQTDNNSLWLLTVTTPTWVQVGTALPFSGLTSTPTTLAGYGITDAQPLDTELTALAGLTSAANKGIQFTGSGTAATFDLTAAGKALLDDAAASNQRTTLGLGTIATQDANSVTITGGSVTGITDVALADGGTGASLTDPNADRILFWDDSAGAMTWLTPGTGLTITTTTIDASGGGSALTVEEVDGSPTDSAVTKIVFPNGTLGIASHVATYTPAAGGSASTTYTSAYASPPGSPVNGDTWIPSDSPYTAYRVSGAWVWRYKGSPITLPDALSLTAVNQGTATLTNTGGAQRLLAPANGTSNLRIWQATPAGASFKLRAGVSQGHLNQNFASAGIMVRDSAGGRIINFALYQGSGVMVQQYTGFTSGFSSTPFISSGGFSPDYLEIEEDATTRYFRVGRLGFAMTTVYSHAVATWLTTNRTGIYADSNNATYDAFLEVWDLTLT